MAMRAAGRSSTERRQLRTKCEFTGHRLSIELLVLDNESCPVGEFLLQLTEQERRRIDVLFELLGTTGHIANKEHFKKIEGTDLFEFKRHQLRFLCFYTADRRVVVCHALRKKKDKHRRRDLEHAAELMKKYLDQDRSEP